jgi:ATP-dependent DNA helicase UvrD/PcrA
MSAADDHFDAEADEMILACLDLGTPRSFFLYAGAGSGKTRSLVEAIRTVCREQGRQLSLTGQKIAIITYTNAACDEIKQRLEFDPHVEVSTIHAFAWSLIAGYNADMRQWLAARLLQDVAELKEAQAKGRPGSKAAADRARSIDSKLRRHAGLEAIRRFVYSPTGDNRTRDCWSAASRSC